jgi:23S rRNA (uridine2552-2'-O)-methyltransferase
MPRRLLHDRYFKQAKAEGYLARSAYKLIQIDDRKRLIRPGDRVLDLGCAPGSWLQVAAERVGPHGVVVGLDLQPVQAPLPATVRTLQADAFTTPPAALLDLAGGPFDVILSDMAPSTGGGGGGSADHFRSVDLCRRVLHLAGDCLKPRGHLVMKVFEGEAYPDLLRDTAALFDEARGFKPQASREVSREIYIVAKGFHAGTPPPSPPPSRRSGQPHDRRRDQGRDGRGGGNAQRGAGGGGGSA